MMPEVNDSSPPWTLKDFKMVEWMDHLLFELVTSPIFLMVSFFLPIRHHS